MIHARSPRLYVDGALRAGETIAPGPKQTSYLLNVMRLKEGAVVRLFNGRDGEWLTEMVSARKRDAALRCVEQVLPQTTMPELCYLFAPLKAARLDYLVQKATEMGASCLMPVITERTVARRVNLTRMGANAIEAAEQCNLLSVPEVRAPSDLAAAIAGWDGGKRLVYCDEAAPVAAPLDALRRIGGTIGGVLIGPEGGFSDDERELLRAREFVVPISLGPRIMRADTAGVAILALVQAVSGDWR